jgi:hypothetical protein
MQGSDVSACRSAKVLLLFTLCSSAAALLHACCTPLQVAELSELPFYPDQISLLMRTGVLMGVHGAGLANQVFMRPRLGAVVEVRLLPALLMYSSTCLLCASLTCAAED